jgi:isopentenyldiphosphate isomerase
MGEFDEAERVEREKRERNFELQQQKKSGIPYDKNDLLGDIRKRRENEREKQEKCFTEMESSKRKELVDLATQAHFTLKSSNQKTINGLNLKKEIIAIADDYIEENEICYVIGIMKNNGFLFHTEQFNIKLSSEEQIYEISQILPSKRKTNKPLTIDEVDETKKPKLKDLAIKLHKTLLKFTKNTYNGEELVHFMVGHTENYLWKMEACYVIKVMVDRGLIKQNEQVNESLCSDKQTYDIKR